MHGCLQALLIDDHSAEAELFREMLSGSPRFEVESVSSEQLAGAIAKCGQRHFDVVLLGVPSKSNDGLDVIRSLQSAIPETPLIVLTGDDKLASLALKMGAHACLSKSAVGEKSLLRSVERSIERWVDQASARLAAIVRSSDDAIISVDLDGTIITWNEGAARIFGYRAEEIVGRPASILYPPESRSGFNNRLELIRNGQRMPHFEVERVCKDGRRICASVTLSPMNDETGRVVGFSKIVRDITDRKQAEEALRQQADILEQIHDSVIATDLEGNIKLWNKGAERIFGYTAEEAIGRNCRFLHTQQEGDALEERYFVPLRAKGRLEFETHVLNKSGQVSFIHVSLSMLHDSTGNPTGMIGYSLDVTARKQAEEEVRFQAHVLNAVGEAVIATDRQGKISYWNRAAEKMYGWSAAEVLGRNKMEAIGSDRCEKEVAETIPGLPNGETWSRELPAKRRDGTLFPAIRMLTPIHNAAGELAGTVDISQDITDRKRAEEMLHRQALFFENVSDGVIVTSTNGLIIDCNPAAERMFGYSKSEMLGQSPELLHAVRDPRATSQVYDALERSGRWAEELAFRRKDGSQGVCHATILPLRDRESRIIAMIGVHRDVTDQKRAEAELRESERRYRLLAEHSTDVISQFHLDGTCLYVSPACRTLIGYEPAELEGRLAYELIDAEDVPLMQKAHESILAQNSPITLVHRMRQKSGHLVWFETIGKAVTDAHTGQATAIICVSRDVTARKHAEDLAHRQQSELAHISRLHSMGELASGIAHELNQPLTTITHYADACAQVARLPASDNVENLVKWTHKISEQAERAGQIVHGMKSFVRKSEPCRVKVDLLATVREAVKLMETDARWRGIHMHLATEANIPPLRADRLQIQQVLVNLLRNAFDAMEKTEPSQRMIKIHLSLVQGSMLEVAVEDRGKGISPEDMERVFDPFFTTKSDGLGVGLAISRSIIESHGGRLSVTANPGCGVTFSFILPTLAGDIDNGSEAPRSCS